MLCELIPNPLRTVAVNHLQPNILHLSNAHVNPAAIWYDPRQVGVGQLYIGSFEVVLHASGWLVIIDLTKKMPSDIEKWFEPIYQHCVDNQMPLVYFDRDAENHPDLPSYRW